MAENKVFKRVLLFAQCILLGGVIFLEPTPTYAKEEGSMHYRGREYRDPTRNPLLLRPYQEEEEIVPEVVRLPSVTIQGVVWGGDAPKAIIDERVVTKGDILPEGIEILDISKTGIKALYRGKIFTLFPKGVIEER